MAPNVDIRIRILGGIQAALQADTVAEAMDQLQDNTDQVARAAVRTTAALKRLTRELVESGAAAWGSSIGFRRLSISLTFTSITAWSLATLALPALAIALWNVAAAAAVVTTAFIGGFLGLAAAAGVMAVGVIDRFKQMSGVIGSAANDLQNAGYAVRGAFRDAVGPGADALMSGLAKGLQKLVPLIRSLQGSFIAVGQAFGDGFEHIFTVISTMGPQLREMFARLVPAIRAGADLTASLFQAFVQIATVGAPLLTSAFTWLNRQVQKFAAAFTDGKLEGAKKTLSDFAAGVKSFLVAFAEPIAPGFGPAMAQFGSTWKILGPKLGHVLGKIVAGFMQFGTAVLPYLTKGVDGISKAVDTIVASGALGTIGKILGDVFSTLAQDIGTVVGWLNKMGLLKPILIGLTAAFFAFNLVVDANPISVVILAIAGLVVAVQELYRNNEGFRKSVNGAWTWIKGAAGWMVKAFHDVRDAIQSVIDAWDKLKAIPGHIDSPRGGGLSKAGRGFNPFNGFEFPDFHKYLGGHAGGGTMTTGGLTWVGERGPEIVNLPRASTVFTAAQSRSIASGDRPARAQAPSMPQVVHQVFQAVLPDGRVLAETVHDWNVGQEALQG